MLDFLKIRQKAFGLDISDSSLKIIQLKKRGKFFGLSSWGNTEIKPGVIESGEIKNEEEFVKAIKQSLNNVRGKKLKTRNVVVSLPEEKAFLEIIQLPKMEEEELRSAIMFQAENYIPLPINEVYFDFQIATPLFNHLDHYDISLTAFPKKIIDRYLLCLKRAGLSPKVLEVESQATTRALIKNNVSPSPLFLINFGKNKTVFIIFSGYSVRFSSSIPISLRDLTKAISQTLAVDLEEAEKLQSKYGLISSETTKDKKRDKVCEILKPLLNELCDHIKKYLTYYQSSVNHEHLNPSQKTTNNKRAEKIILCGEGANLKGLSEFLSSTLNVPTELADPWVNILAHPPKKEIKGLSLKESLNYATALGLALRGIKKNYD